MHKIFLCGALVAIFAFGAKADQRPGPGSVSGAGPEQMIQRYADELGLDGQQRLDLQIIMADYQPRLTDLVKLGHGLAEELLEIAPDAPDYIARTQAASAAAAAATAEFVVLLAEMRGKLYAVLRREQRARITELIAERRAEMRARIEEKKSSRP